MRISPSKLLTSWGEKGAELVVTGLDQVRIWLPVRHRDGARVDARLATGRWAAALAIVAPGIAAGALWLAAFGGMTAVVGPPGLASETASPNPASALTLGEPPQARVPARESPALRREWVRTFGGSSDDAFSAVASGADGSLYVVGTTASDDLAPGLARAGREDIFVARYSSTGDRVWITLVSGPGADIAEGIAVGRDGSAFIVGRTTSRSLLGAANHGEQDALIAKLDAKGGVAWLRLLGGSEWDIAAGVAVAPGGAVYVAGWTESRRIEKQRSNGSAHVLLARYTASGDRVWLRLQGGAWGVIGTGVAASRDGAVYVTGYLAREATVAGRATNTDAFVARYQGGRRLWMRTIGGPGPDRGSAITVGRDGSIVLAGSFAKETDQPGHYPNAGQPDVLVAKFNRRGDRIWHRFYGDHEGELGFGVSVRGDGSIYAVARTGVPTAFDDVVDESDVVLLGYDQSGKRLMARPLGIERGAFDTGIVLDSFGAAYVGASTEVPPTSGENDVVLMKLVRGASPARGVRHCPWRDRDAARAR